MGIFNSTTGTVALQYTIQYGQYVAAFFFFFFVYVSVVVVVVVAAVPAVATRGACGGAGRRRTCGTL
jgi:hypothetical protein